MSDATQLPSYDNCLSGASRDRTGDLLLAKQALSQLSYGPVRPSVGQLSPLGLIAELASVVR